MLACVTGQARRMLVKLDIYRKFTNALAVAVIVSVGWMCYEVINCVTDGMTRSCRNLVMECSTL